VSLFDSQPPQDSGKFIDLPIDIRIGENSLLTGFSFPYDGRLIAPPGRNMTMQATVGNVDFSAHKPPGLRWLPIQHLIPFLKPVEALGGFGPKGFGVFVGFGVNCNISHDRLLVEIPRRREYSLFSQQSFNGLIGIGHGLPRISTSLKFRVRRDLVTNQSHAQQPCRILCSKQTESNELPYRKRNLLTPTS